jgi:hypothetical protein
MASASAALAILLEAQFEVFDYGKKRVGFANDPLVAP